MLKKEKHSFYKSIGKNFPEGYDRMEHIKLNRNLCGSRNLTINIK